MERIARPMWGILALRLFLICGLARPVSASIVYVNRNPTGTVPDGKTWPTAFLSVQSAINAASSGDEVWVAAGTYYESVTLKQGVPLYGGFAGTETVRSQRDWKTNATVLDGNNSTSVNLITSSVKGGVVDAFTIRRGYSGVYVSYGTATITHCTITGNYMGVNIQYSPSQTSVANCAISGNTRYGVNLYNGPASVTNCTITRNSGGIFVDDYGQCSVTNCIVAFNGKGISRISGGVLSAVSHNDVYGSTLANYWSIYPSSADLTGSNGNISQDPKLSNSYHDLHIQPDSPCLDAGDDSAVQSDGTDIDGQPRTIGKHVDIGADESDGTAWTVPSHTWYVSPHGNNYNDGLSWTTAKQSVSAALDVAQGSDELWVANGTYPEILTIPAGVTVYGGFAGAETQRNQRDWKTNDTVIDGNGSTSPGVIRADFEGVLIDGFTARGGAYGVSVTYYTSAPRITNCTISGNSSGGIHVFDGGEASITGCTISNNASSGVAVGDSAWASVANCTISGNQYGVHLFNTSGTTLVSNCAISGNTTGVYASYGEASIANCVVTGNSSYGVYVHYCEAGVANCTITGNAAGVYVDDRGTASVTNCIALNNDIGISRYSTSTAVTLLHNDVFGSTSANFKNFVDPTGTNGNISADPVCVNQPSGDYHLLAGSPCIDEGDDSVVAPGETDFDGTPRIRYSHVDMGAYEFKEQITPWTASLGAAVSGGVTVAEKVAYVCGGDGKVYARSTTDGSDVSGFPVDINAAVGATVKLPSRPAVYYGRTGKAIYLTTDRGDVLRVLPDGTVAWHIRPLTGQTESTPAVTPDGYVYVNLSTGSGPFNNYVFKLDEATGTPVSLSPFVGYTTADNIGDFSPAANGRYLYVNAGWGSGSGLTLLNQDNLAVRSSFAGGEQCLSPLLLGSDLLLASKGGKAWKMNAVTLAPDLGFGHFGVADLGSPITASPFSDAAGNVYVGTTDGRILKWTPGTGSFQPFYAANGKIAGLTIDRTAGVLGFGTSNGSFVQVPLANPTSATTATPGGPISTGTVYDSLTDRFLVVTDTGVLSGYPAVR